MNLPWAHWFFVRGYYGHCLKCFSGRGQFAVVSLWLHGRVTPLCLSCAMDEIERTPTNATEGLEVLRDEELDEASQ